MTEKKTDPAVAPVPPAEDGVQDESAMNPNWEFLNRVPTLDDVKALLATLPPVWGVATVDYADYVQALPQTKKIKISMPDNPAVKVAQNIDTFSLYMSVAGRIKMINAAAEMHGWLVDFEPEAYTPTGVPGYISLDPKIVYREYVAIKAATGVVLDDQVVMVDDKIIGTPNREYRSLGRKPGTAWVPASGGLNAAGSNPYEKVETSARGRAIAAWGFGVLPGSGVASVEEILGSNANKAFLDAEVGAGRGRNGGQPRRSRGDLLQEVLTVAEEVRQARGITEPEMKVRLGSFLSGLGITDAYDTEAETVRWEAAKDGQIVLLVNSLTDSLRHLRNEEGGV